MKRWLALILVFVMTVLSPLAIYADLEQTTAVQSVSEETETSEVPDEASEASDTGSVPVTASGTVPVTDVSGDRFSEENLTDGDLVYFGVSNITIGEGDGIYRIPLFREGDISKPVSVTIHSLDMTALYGQDYLLLGEDKTEYKSDMTLLQRSMSDEETEPTAYHFVLDEEGNILSAEKLTATPSSATSSDSAAETGTEERADSKASDSHEASLLSSSSDQQELDGMSRLAFLKEQETGLPTRESLSGGLNNNLTGSFIDQLTPELLESIYYSCEQVLQFEAGQDTAYLSFRIFDDQQAEGSETFSLVLTESDGAEPYIATSLSVVLEDDEETVHSQISFDRETYEGTGESVTVILRRTQALYSIASVNVTGVDEQGNETLYGVAAFAPYEETKEFTLNLDGVVKLKLTDFEAADAGERIEAQAVCGQKVTTDAELYASGDYTGDAAAEEKTAEEETADSALYGAADNGSSALSFDITVDGKTYTVRYEKGDTVGKIMDTGYDPELEVGRYLFSTSTGNGGSFIYGEYTGANPGWKGHRANEYSITEGEKDFSKGKGILEWYFSSTTRRGSAYAYMKSSASCLPALYYQFLIPDWEMTTDKYKGQEMWMAVTSGSDDFSKAFATGVKTGKFYRELSMGAAVQVKNQRAGLGIRVSAVDNTKWLTPQSYGRFYGVAAFYKKYTISIHNPSEMEFETGMSSKQKFLPAQFSVQCGAQKEYYDGTRDFYVNPSEEDSNLVFTMKDNTINGVPGKYSVLKGYTIKITAPKEEQSVTLNYPADFYQFLSTSGRTSTSSIDYSNDAVKAEKTKVAADLGTVCMDKYFIDWIESNQKYIYEKGVTYYQALSFTPVVDYNEISVHVVDRKGYEKGNGANFNDTRLVSGSVLTLHAGDRLELGATPEDDKHYRVTGYEVSTKKGSAYNSIRVTKDETPYLVLEAGKEYWIRPLVEENYNRVEIQFLSKEAENNLQICNLIPESLLEELPQLKGDLILNLHKEKTTAIECMKPDVGDICSVQVLVTGKPAESGYVYRPVIRDKMTGLSYNAQQYDFTMRTEPEDNLIQIGIEKVKESDLKTVDLRGSVVTNLTSIRSDGKGMHATPAAGYSVISGNGQQTVVDAKTQEKSQVVRDVNAVTSVLGEFLLSGMNVKQGDRITLLIDNGSYDAQVADLTIKGNDAEINLGEVVIGYPLNAPEVSSLSYDYDKDSSRKKQGDLKDNQIKVLDDCLTLSAVVDSRGRNIEKVVFQVITVTGSRTTYEALPVEKGSNVYSVKTGTMTEEFHNGDRVLCYLVDEEKNTITIIDAEGKEQKVEIEITYPVRETGLSFFVENERIAPKELDVDSSSQQLPTVNVPMLGTAAGNLSSGTLRFTRTDYTGGYMLSVNFKKLIRRKGPESPEPTVEQSVDAAKKYRDLAENIASAKRRYAEAGEDAEYVGERAEQVDGVFRDADAEMFNDIFKASDRMKAWSDLTDAKEAVAGLTRNSSIEMDALFVVNLDFVYDPVKEEHVLAYGAVTIGGSFSTGKTWYALVGYVPCFLNLSGYAQANLVLGGKSQTISEDHFNETAGNIRDLLSGDDFLWEVDTIFKGSFGVGAGLCGVLAARGSVTVQLQLEFTDDPSLDTFWGIALLASGNLTFDLVLASLKVEIASTKNGWGTMKDKFKDSDVLSFFDHNISVKSGEEGQQLAGVSGDASEEITEEAMAGVSTDVSEELEDLCAEVLSEEYGAGSEEELLNALLEAAWDNAQAEAYDYGTADMSLFGQSIAEDSVQAKPGQSKITPLLEDAAERTRPELIDLGDGRLFLVFLGSREENSDACLYYAIRNTDGSWQTPHKVSEDKTYDTMPDVIRAGNQIYIAWADASKELEPVEDFKQQYQSFGISGAVYDIQAGTMGEEFEITQARDRGFFNLAPQLSATEDAVYCIFLTEDVSKAEKISDIADFSTNYHTMQISRLDLKTGEKKNEYVTVKNPYLTDPVVIDYRSEAMKIAGKEYLLTTYTVDLDKNTETGQDRELYLEIHNVTDSRDYYPIRISENLVTESVPQLTRLNNTVYLAWLTDGQKLSILDVRCLIESFFNSGNSEVQKAFDVYDPEDADWYLKSAADLGMEEEEYQGSVYALLHEGNFGQQTADLSESDTNAGSIGDYALASDGVDIYIFYTDYGAAHEDSSMELYGMRYVESASPKPYEAGSETYEEDDVNQGSWYFTQPVQLTDCGMVLDDFTVLMDGSRTIYAASDYYAQSINGDGETEVSGNCLAFAELTAGCSVATDPYSVNLAEDFETGKTAVISFDVVNEGLMDAEGFDMKVYLVSGETAVLVDGETVSETLGSGMTREMTAEFTVPEDLSDSLLRIVLTEQAAAGENTCEITLQHEEKIEVTAGEAEIVSSGEGKAVISIPVTVENSGSDTSLPALLKLQNDDDEESIFVSENVPALKSGEKKEYTLSFEAGTGDWNKSGSINLRAAVLRDGEELDTGYGSIYSSVPLILELDCAGKTGTVSVKKGEQKTLSVTAAPWQALLSDVKYISSDPSVAGVDENGVVTAKKYGSAVITAYSTEYGISDSISILVTSKESKEDDDDGGGSAKPVKTGTWNDPVTDGTWAKAADGSWSYRTNALFCNTWGYILNPYAKEEKYKYAWFWFDEKGRMLTGWQQIGGKWYYLNPVSDGTLGMCYLDTTTPDGYKVDRNGVWIP